MEDFETIFTINDNSTLYLSKKKQKFLTLYIYNIDKDKKFKTLLVSSYEGNESIKNKILEKENIDIQNRNLYFVDFFLIGREHILKIKIF